jgi:hypothetical protein
MTDQETNIAIAQACGKWRRVMTDEEWKLRYKKWCAEPDDPHAELTCPSTHDGTVPDYCNDLNATHEMEEHLNTALMEPTLYSNELLAIVGKAVSVTSPMAGCFFHIHATARQRAEAFLRVKGLWREA